MSTTLEYIRTKSLMISPSRYHRTKDNLIIIFSDEDNKREPVAIFEDNSTIINRRKVRFASSKYRTEMDEFIFHPLNYPHKAAANAALSSGVGQSIILPDDEWFGVNWRFVLKRTQKNTDTKQCFYCATTEGEFNRDHIVPRNTLRKRKVKSIPNNVVVCCVKCNSEKASLHPVQWLGVKTMELKYGQNNAATKTIVATLLSLTTTHARNLQLYPSKCNLNSGDAWRTYQSIRLHQVPAREPGDRTYIKLKAES